MRKQIYSKNRNCPECGKKLSAYRMAFIKNRKCQSCANKELNKIYKNVGWKKKISKYININSPYTKKCPNCNNDMIYNNKYTFIYSIKNNKKCTTCANTGKNAGRVPKIYERTPDILRKQRIAAINRIQNSKGQIVPNFNPTACKIIENYGKQNGYNFQHAMNGGEFHIKELGYFLDGYDKNTNVVIECYEKEHFKNNKLKIKDIHRQREIINHLSCKFIEYDFRKGEFIHVN